MKKNTSCKFMIVLILSLVVIFQFDCCTNVKIGRVAFLSQGEHNFQDIYSMNTDGSDLVKLARLFPFQMPYHNVWSADGKKLAYIDYEEDTQSTWISIVDVYGQNRWRVYEITGLGIESMAMSPDGKTIVISLDTTRVNSIEKPGFNTETKREADLDLFSIDLKTGKLRRLTDTPDLKEKWPAYAPDGKQIAFVGGIDTETSKNVPRDVFIMDVDNGYSRLLVHHSEGQFFFNPDLCWSPDGNRIAYALYNMSISDFEHFTDIFLVDIKEDILTNITNSPFISDSDPAWSPDNLNIAYYSGNMTEGYETKVFSLESGYTNAYDYAFPAWTPDGKELIYRNPQNVFEYGLMNINDNKLRTLAVLKDIIVSRPFWLY